MTTLQQRQEKIQIKRKKTSRRTFVREICSYRNLIFYKTSLGVSKYPQSLGREMNLINYGQQRNLESLELEVNNQALFFDQLSYLYHHHQFPLVNHYGVQENSQRGDEIWGAKNAYLSVAVGDNAENVLYTFKGESSVKNIISSVNITQNSENIYNSKTVRFSYKVFFSRFIYNSKEIRFCDNLLGCTECILCNNLENKSYCIKNVEYSKEEYLLNKKKILSEKSKFDQYYSSLSNKGNITLCTNVISGYTLYNCSDVENAYEISNLSRARNVLYCDGGSDSSDCYDVIDSAVDRTHHLYAVMGQAFGDHVYCSVNIVESSYIYYSFMLQNCSFCLGCMHLKNKSYCILNKQYTKEKRYERVDEIFLQMEKNGQLGEFFPASMNPFYFNDTAAYLIDPSFTKEEVMKLGYLRRDDPIKVDIPEGASTVKSSELGQFESSEQTHPILPGQGAETQWKLDETVCKRVIIDENGDAYRIIPMELEFLQQHGLPLPRRHRLAKMKENFKIH